MFYKPPYSMPQGRFIMTNTPAPDDAKLRSVLNRFLAAIGLPEIAPDEDLVTALQARADHMQTGSGPSAPAPTTMSSRLRKGTAVRSLADNERHRREVAARVAKSRGLTFADALSMVPE